MVASKQPGASVFLTSFSESERKQLLLRAVELVKEPSYQNWFDAKTEIAELEDEKQALLAIVDMRVMSSERVRLKEIESELSYWQNFEPSDKDGLLLDEFIDGLGEPYSNYPDDENDPRRCYRMDSYRRGWMRQINQQIENERLLWDYEESDNDPLSTQEQLFAAVEAQNSIQFRLKRKLALNGERCTDAEQYELDEARGFMACAERCRTYVFRVYEHDEKDPDKALRHFEDLKKRIVLGEDDIHGFGYKNWSFYSAKPKPVDAKETDTPLLRPVLYSMDTIKPEKIDWFWKDRFPRGNLTILAGQGGLGKSTLVCDLIGRVTTGKPLPGEQSSRKPERVLMVNLEDDPATVLRQRLDAAGADVRLVANIEGFQRGEDEGVIWIDFQLHSSAFEKMIENYGITFLVVDPISGHMGSTKQNDTAQVRQVLQKLQAVAKNTGCTILVLTHSPKASANAQAAFIGSQAFLSCARAGFVVIKDPDDQNRVLFLNAKANYSADKSGLAYRFEDVDGTGRIVWDESPVTQDPDSYFGQQPMTGNHSSDREPKAIVAARKLSEFLRVPKSVKETKEWATAEGITLATLRLAKEKNGHDTEKRADGYYWLPAPGADLW